jgi:hypothetical protein
LNQYVIAKTILNIIWCDRKSPINNSRAVICSLNETKVIVQQITSADIIFNETLPRLVIGTSRTVGSAKKFVRITSGFGGGEFCIPNYI